MKSDALTNAKQMNTRALSKPNGMWAAANRYNGIVLRMSGLSLPIK